MDNLINITNEDGKPVEAERANGHIYVIERRCDGAVKIGRSSCPSGRIFTLSSQGGFEVKRQFESQRCSNPSELEAFLHRTFADRRIGGEWFAIDWSDVVDVAKGLDYKPLKFDTKEDIERREENTEAMFRALEIGKTPEHFVPLEQADIDELAKKLVDKMFDEFENMKRQRSLDRYIKGGLGDDREDGEVELVKQRVLLMLNAEAWQDIPYEKLISNMGVVDESIRSVKSFRTKKQVSLFDN